MMDGLFKPDSEAPVVGHRARWPFDPAGPLVLLATVLSTIAVFVYVIEFRTGTSGTPAVYLLEDPVSDLIRVSEAARQITQAGEDLPGWLQEWGVETPQVAREDAEQRWEELILEYQSTTPDGVALARVGQLIALAGWGDAESMAQLRLVPAYRLEQFPADVRQQVDTLVAAEAPSGPTRAGRAALAFSLSHMALEYVFMFGGIIGLGWWVIRRRPSLRLSAAPRAGTFGLLRGCEVWIWCMLIYVSIPLFMWLFGGPGGPANRLTDATWQVQSVMTGIPALLLVQLSLLQPQGRTLLGLYAVTRSRVMPMILVALVIVGLTWSFGWGIWSVTLPVGGGSTWADYVLNSNLSGPRWLWMLDSLNGIIAAPIVEEVLFRGVLYAALRTRCSVVQAAVISALIFSGAHGYDLIPFFQITFSGFVYALTYEYTRSLAPCVLAHAIHNLSVSAYALPYLMV